MLIHDELQKLFNYYISGVKKKEKRNQTNLPISQESQL